MQIDKSVSHEKTPVLAGIRVLVFDEQAEARELMKILLERHGVLVEFAKSGREAMDLLSESLGTDQQPDLFICDTALPDQDGYGLMKKVRSMELEHGIDFNRGLLAIGIINGDNAANRVKALAAGYQMLISRPIEPVELLVVVRSLLDRRSTT